MAPVHECLVMTMENDGRLPKPGKHRAHPPHDWWYTSSDGGHQMNREPVESDNVKNVKKWHCPGKQS